MTPEETETLLERFVREVLAGEDYDAIEELFVPSLAEPTPTITGGIAETVADIEASYRTFHDRVSISDIELLTVHATATEALAVWTGTTEYHDSFRGLQPAGKGKRHQEVTWIELADGRIERVHHLRDSLETIPPAARVAHTSALSTLETGVVAVDKDGDVVHANAAALDIADCDREAALGTPVRELLGDAVALLYPGEQTEISLDNGQRVYEVVASPLRDERFGVTVGRFLLLHDVTERQHRVQRLQVLNRVLRHNLRNHLTAIVGRVEYVHEVLEDLPGQVDEALETAIEVGNKLTGVSAKARRVESALTPEQRTPHDQDLAAVARQLVDRAREEYPAVDVEFDGGEPVSVRAARSLQAGLWALVENACEHNDADDPHVTVRVDREGDTGVLTVADNGPGVPEEELAVLEAGEETQLQHGSGLGLWLAHWVVQASGGALSFADREPRGSVATVELSAVD